MSAVVERLLLGHTLRNKANKNKYTILEFIGQGCYGKVAKCKFNNTEDLVAVKLMHSKEDAMSELSMMRKIKEKKPNNLHRLIQFHEAFVHLGCICIVYELLEMDLITVVNLKMAPLSVNQIRPIAKQMLEALQALKEVGIVHADIKPDNIMVTQRPLQVKLIDFGLAETFEDAQFSMLQAIGYRAPEVSLGLPMMENIDMWGLGCTLAYLFLNKNLFPIHCEYLMMKSIVQMVGMPLDNILDCAPFTKKFFRKEEKDSSWRLLKPEEYNSKWASNQSQHNSLDDLLSEKEDGVEMRDNIVFIQFLKKLLNPHCSTRISPEKALQHPFITMVHLRDPASKEYRAKADQWMGMKEPHVHEDIGCRNIDETTIVQTFKAAHHEPETDASDDPLDGIWSLFAGSDGEDVETNGHVEHGENVQSIQRLNNIGCENIDETTTVQTSEAAHQEPETNGSDDPLDGIWFLFAGSDGEDVETNGQMEHGEKVQSIQRLNTPMVEDVPTHTPTSKRFFSGVKNIFSSIQTMFFGCLFPSVEE